MRSVSVRVQVSEGEIYRHGCTVVSTGSADLLEGENLLIVEGLPEGIDNTSVSLSVPSAITLGQVRVVEGELDQSTELDQQIDELDRVIGNKEIELDSWKDLASKMGGSAAIEYLDRLPATLDRLTTDLGGLRSQRRELSQRRDQEREQQLRPHLEVEVASPAAGTMPFELRCRSSRAGWAPSYDVVVEDLDKPLQLRLKGRVWQRTGIDWSEAKLSLSTGTADVMGDLPRFAPRFLRKREAGRNVAYGKRMPAPPQLASVSGQNAMMSKAAPAAASMGDTNVDIFSAGSLREAPAPQSEVSEQATVTTYELPGSYTLDSGDEQTLTVLNSELEASYRLYAYPRKEEAAYLVACLAQEPSPQVLEHPLSVYLEGSFVGSVRIGRTDADEGYELPLGRDGRVRVRRSEETRRSKRLLSGKVTREHTCDIVIESRRSEPAELVVLEQVPVSHDKEIEVTLRSAGGATFDEARGELRWTCTLHPGELVELSAGYAVTHPQGLVVEEEERRGQGSASGTFCRTCGSYLTPGMRFCLVCGSPAD